MSEKIKDLYRRALGKGAKNISVPKGKKGIHTAKFHRAVTKIAKSGSATNPYAAAMASLGKKKALKKKPARPR